MGVLRATVAGRFEFIQADAETTGEPPGAPFDLVYARLLLFHLRDPVAMVRKMYAWTRPGGVLLVQDWDCRTMDILPRLATWKHKPQQKALLSLPNDTPPEWAGRPARQHLGHPPEGHGGVRVGRSSAARRGSMVVRAWSTRMVSGVAPCSATHRREAVNRTAASTKATSSSW